MAEELNEEHQERIGRIVEEFMAKLRSNQRPSIDDYLAQYPELGTSLATMLKLVSNLENQSTIDVTQDDHRQADTSFELSVGSPTSLHSLDHSYASEHDWKDSDIGTSRRIGKFQMLEKIGQGGFGQVWKARDLQLGRLVAVKLLRKQMLDDQSTRERFLREARAAGQLRHPNIVPVYEVADLDGVPAIISSLVQGVTLKELLQCRKLSFRESATLMVDVSSAIQYAHSVNLIHRDIKPANIMIEYGANQELNTPIDSQAYTRQSSSKSSVARTSITEANRQGPRPLVLDFGLALRDEIEATMTVEGQILGTPAYMSPEQASGRGHDVDGRTDVYALGAVFYEMLCGEPPFSGSKVAILHQVLHDEPRAPRIVRPDIPKDVETICLKALAKIPSQRYATAADFASDLLRWLHDEPILARRPTALEQLRRGIRRYPALAGSVIGIFVMLLLFSSVAIVYAFRFQQLATRADEARQKADQARAQEAQALTASKLTLQKMYSSFGIQSERNGQPIQGAPWFAQAIQQVSSLNQSKTENQDKPHWLRLQNCALSSAQPVLAWSYNLLGSEVSSEPKQLSWHPSGKWLVVRSTQYVETIWNLTNDTHVRLKDIQAQLQPDGGEQQAPANTYLLQAEWSVDGKYLIAIDARGTLIRVEVDSWLVVDRVPINAIPYLTKFSDDGSKLVMATEGALLVVDVETVSITARVPCPRISSLTVDATGDNIAAHGIDNRVRIFVHDANGYNEIATYPATSAVVPLGTGIQFRAQGGLAWLGEDQSLAVCNQLLDQPTIFQRGEIQSIRFSSSGRLGLCIFGFQARILDTGSGRAIGDTIRHRNNILDVSFSRDGAMVATAAGDRTVGVYSTSNAEPVVPQILHESDLRVVSFSPDSRYLATGQLDGLIRIWRLPATYRTIDTGSSDQFLEVSADGTRTLAGPWQGARNNKHIQAFDTATGKAMGQQFTHDNFIDGAFISPKSVDDVMVLLSKSPNQASNPRPDYNNESGQIVFWNCVTGATSVPIASPGVLIGGAWSPDGKLAATVDYNGEVCVMDPENRVVLTRLPHGDSYAPCFVTRKRICFSPDGKRLAVWTRLRTSVWDTSTWQLITDYHIGPPEAQHFTHNAVFSNDSRYLAVCTSFKSACVLDLLEKRIVAQLPHTDWVFNADFSPDDLRLATTCRDGQIRIWDWRKGQQVLAPLQHQDEAWAIDYSDDGLWLISGARDSRVRFWDAKSGEPVTPAIRMPYWVYDVRFLNQLNLAVAAGAGQNVCVFDLKPILDLDKTLAASSPQQLEQYSEVLSSQRIVEQDVTNLTTKEWLQAWQGYTGRGMVTIERVVDEGAARFAAKARLRSSLRTAYRAGKWDECRRALELIIQEEPTNWRMYFELIVVLAEAKDYVALAALQDKIVERFGEVKSNASQLEQISKSLLIVANLNAHSEKAYELAELAVANSAGSGYAQWFKLNLGLARLRQKRWQEAEEIFDPLQKEFAVYDSHISAIICVYNAQAKSQLGKPDDAEACLQQARKFMKNAPNPAQGKPYLSDWSDWLRAHVLLRDLEAQ